VTLALSLAAIGAAFLAGMAIGLYEESRRRRRPAPVFGLEPLRCATACAIDDEEEPPLFI
jgi:hypothetical protein